MLGWPRHPRPPEQRCVRLVRGTRCGGSIRGQYLHNKEAQSPAEVLAGGGCRWSPKSTPQGILQGGGYPSKAGPKRRGQGTSNPSGGSPGCSWNTSARALTPGQEVGLEDNRRPSLKGARANTTPHSENGLRSKARTGASSVEPTFPQDTLSPSGTRLPAWHLGTHAGQQSRRLAQGLGTGSGWSVVWICKQAEWCEQDEGV